MSTPIAVGTALAAALFLGISAVADQRSTKRVKTEKALSPRILLDLVRQPLWVAAVGANIVGFALQVVALSFGSLAVVQPLLVCDLIFAVLISRYLLRRSNTPRPGGRHADLAVFTGVAATALGVAGFLAIGQPSGGSTHASFSILPPLVIVIVVLVGGCLAVAARYDNVRPLALALGCGVCYGVAAFAIKLVTSDFDHGLAGLFSNWPIYVLLVVGPVGYLLNQDAFQQGTFLAPVQAIITAADPVLSVALGIVWLDVRVRSSPAAIAGEVASLVVMVIGIVITSESSPQVTAAAEAAQTDQRPTPSNPLRQPTRPVQQFDEVALRVGDERHPHPGFRRRARRHDRPRATGEGPLVRRVQVGDVERHVPVPVPQRGLAGSTGFAARRRTRPATQLGPVAVPGVDEHLDAEVQRLDPDPELAHEPEHVAEPRGGRRQVADRQPDVVQPGGGSGLVSHARSALPGHRSGTT